MTDPVTRSRVSSAPGTLAVRLLYRFYRAGHGPLRWLRRRFTGNGLVLVGGILLSIGSYSREQTMGGPVALVLIALLAAASITAPFFHPRVRLRRHPPRSVEAGVSFALRVTIDELAGRRWPDLAYREQLRDEVLTLREFIARLRLLTGRPNGGTAQSAPPRIQDLPLPVLPASGTLTVQVEVLARRRGMLRLGGGCLLRTDPFGLLRSFARFPAADRVLVLPRRQVLPAVVLPGRRDELAAGEAAASAAGETEEFTTLRDYRPGDPPRRIHWRSVARSGRLVVREYQAERSVRPVLLLDTRAGPRDEEVFEEAVSIAASLACPLAGDEPRVDLLLAGPVAIPVTAGPGAAAGRHLLEALATVTPSPVDALATQESLLLRSGQPSGCILVLLAWDGARRGLVGRLQARGIPCLVLVVVGSAAAGGAVATEEGILPPERLVMLPLDELPAALHRLAEP